MNIRGGIIRGIPENVTAFFDRLAPARGMPVSANPPNNSEPADEPETITDLSELSFDFEEATPSNRRPVYGSATEGLMPGELAEELELLDSLAGQITGDGPPEFYCKPLGQLLGPMSLAELRIMAESGALAEDDLVRYGESGEWKPAGSFSRLAESLHRGSSITSEPVSSAPPSTRRLFQTGYKPTGDSFGEDTAAQTSSVTAEKPAAQTESKSPETAAAEMPVPDNGVGSAEPDTSTEKTADSGSAAVDNSDAKLEPETSKDEVPRRKKAAKKSPAAKKAGKKSAGKKKPAKRRNDEDDAILNDIFSEVFADDQKSQRASMPPAAGPSSGTPDTAAGALPSASNDATAKPPATT